MFIEDQSDYFFANQGFTNLWWKILKENLKLVKRQLLYHGFILARLPDCMEIPEFFLTFNNHVSNTRKLFQGFDHYEMYVFMCCIPEL